MLLLYVIHDHPSDFPDWYVITKWDLSVRLGVFGFCRTLEEARVHLSRKGLVNIGREPDDDPKIVEVWV
jgi:hypothetical protein